MLFPVHAPALALAPTCGVACDPPVARPRHEPFSEHLRDSRCRTLDRVDLSCPAPTFAEHLRAVNTAERCVNDAARRSVVPSATAVRGTDAPRPATSHADSVHPFEPCRPVSALTRTPRLGDLPASRVIERGVRVRETYAVRGLLSRGALIDLMG